MSSPLISVVVPVYNRAHLIARSVGSLIHQSYDNLEIILADDCSTDDLQAAVRALDDPRVRIVRLERNGGASAARNAGVAAARGDFIAFHDSDDIAVGHKLEAQMRALQDLGPEYVGVYTAVLSFSDLEPEAYGGMQVRIVPPPGTRPLSGDMHARTVEGNIMNLPTMLLRKTAVIAAGGFDVRMGNNNDWDFTLRVTRQGLFHFIPEPLYLVPEQPTIDPSGKISRSARKSAKSFAFITGKLRRQNPHTPALARHYATTARFLLRLGRVRFARRYLAHALRLQPAALRVWVLYALCLSPKLYKQLRRIKDGTPS
ncbi:hypothetical protein So717_42450 [Roseobacter cerasinus]|uniref:Glycosyltransferase 2-like domain-containing protein n=1 Tax=Roseobacter cerasinus TaxID=2602289 RepID=A0A640VXT7_9RHOB|nr:glycosyltransferase family A protein [Roseobacter cerasinus]GFE52492.1 hypothetical protein So717_42450 [Roseobacter cerasinus]